MFGIQPLPRKSIRLLKIQPELRDGCVACMLNQFDDQTPTYYALSYYWGPPKLTRKIYVNDSIVDLHEALWEFLDQMQRSHQTENWIWTDFLCLNQKNKEEMGQQIPRMGHIYSEATRTISWLGCSRSHWVSRSAGLSITSTDLETDLRHITEKMATKKAPLESFFAEPMLSWTFITRFMPDERSSLDNPSSFDIAQNRSPRRKLPRAIEEVVQMSQGTTPQAILNIISLPYWRRVWITQEVALAKEVIMIFGDVSLDFDTFFLAYKSYFYYILRTAPDKGLKVRAPIEARAAVTENSVSFRDIVRWGQYCTASRPVDRVYGLLGLLARCGDRTNILPSIFTGNIDYERDLREVYWGLAFTSPCSIDSPAIDELKYKEVIEGWIPLLPLLGQLLTCQFTPESLRYAESDHVTPLLRKRARLALSVVDMCWQAVMTDGNILVNRTTDTSSRSLPSKPCARRLCYGLIKDVNTLKELDSEYDISLERLLGSLLLDIANRRSMDRHDVYQCVKIGLQMFKMEQHEGGWNCVSHQRVEKRIWGALMRAVEMSFDLEIKSASSQLQCSSRTWSGQNIHNRRIPDRYHVILRRPWELSLEDLENRRKGKFWGGTLNAKYIS